MAKAGQLIYQGFLITWDGFWMVWWSNLLWIAFCLPVVTAPLGFAGLYSCAHALVYGESITWKTFFSGIARHWTAGYRWAFFNLAVLLTLAFYAWYLTPLQGTLIRMEGSLFAGVPLAFAMIWLTVNQFTFPFMLTQEKPSYMNALRNSLVMFLKWPGVTLGFSMFNFAVIVFSLWLRFPWLILGASLPGLMACLCVKYAVEQSQVPVLPRK